jgi:hypothetical protein
MRRVRRLEPRQEGHLEDAHHAAGDQLNADTVSQAWIVLTQVPGLWLLAQRDPRVARWGYALCLAAEPAFFYACWQASQWGMFALTAWYTGCFAWGTYCRFWRKA